MSTRPKLYKLLKPLEKVEGAIANIDTTIKAGSNINVGDLYDITVTQETIIARHIPTNRYYKLYANPVDKPKILVSRKTLNPTIAVNNTYPTDYVPVDVSAIDYGDTYDSLTPILVNVSVSGIDTTNAETITVDIELVHEDGSSDVKSLTFTSDGVVTLTLADLLSAVSPTNDGKGIIGIRVWAKTSLASTTATVNVEVIGLVA